MFYSVFCILVCSNLGGLKFYEDSDGNKYAVGADSVPKKLGSEIIYLGTGTSFDIKKLYPEVDYSKLTTNNFFIEAQSFDTGNNGATSSTLAMYTRQKGYYTASAKSYNSSTGILTVTKATVKATTTNDSSFSAVATKESKVYMVI